MNQHSKTGLTDNTFNPARGYTDDFSDNGTFDTSSVMIRKDVLLTFDSEQWIRNVRRGQLAIVPGDGLYLYRSVPSISALDVRFADIFKRTWSKIPLGDRIRMLAHWRTGPMRRLDSPAIYLTMFPPYARSVRGLALCRRSGQELQFYAPLVARMPDEHVAELIAHELAYVVQCTYGNRAFPERDEAEFGTDLLMRQWGFDPDAMDAWFIQHVARVTDHGVRWRRKPLFRHRAEALVLRCRDDPYGPPERIPIGGSLAPFIRALQAGSAQPAARGTTAAP